VQETEKACVFCTNFCGSSYNKKT